MALPKQTPYRKFLRKFRSLGWTGPLSIKGRKGGGRHQFMRKEKRKIAIPNPHHQKPISQDLLKEILKQAGISEDEWEKA